MIEELHADAETRMHRTIEVFSHDLAKIRTGRAHPDILSGVMVNYYGVPTPLAQVANLSVLDATTLSISPWEKNLSPEIEKAIINSGLGLNPVNMGDVLRLQLPPLTQERRGALTKVVRAEAEKAKIVIRNIRRDVNDKVKRLVKDKAASEDDAKRSETRIQKLTDIQIKEVDQLTEVKEKDLMSI